MDHVSYEIDHRSDLNRKNKLFHLFTYHRYKQIVSNSIKNQ